MKTSRSLNVRAGRGYTPGMKIVNPQIAVSVPDGVFEEAEQLARRMKRSRSEVYCRALAEYVARHAPDRVTEAMDRALAEIGEPTAQFVRTASRRVLERSDW
jgi:antitoxin MazE6